MLYDIKFSSEVAGKPFKCTVKALDKGELVRKVTLEYRGIYKVIPDNPNKLKHRDKVGTLVGFKVDKLNNPLKARIKFDETGSIGYVKLENLHHFKNE
ncbi:MULTISPECIES: hypothetical protein [Paenibacillus]|uniref:Uncharacterized protein n=1 Tax=Paenibacillus amylolyticus TaxID=1451 RepID=A0ABD8B2C0_PAEAM|nr:MULTISPECIES: hypothetical protein [unclassified Paenibacillus]PJN64617.1 hypothetical protein PAEAM_07030 [Paenibacillus sp. GM1FR]SDD49296.1 hypothetical protein SAMN05428987_4965 [Paenibacillus sp. CF095]